MHEGKILFNEIVRKWLNEKSMHISLSTQAKYEQLVRNYIVPFFHDVECDNLSNETMNKFHESLICNQDFANLSSGSIRTIIMIVNQSCDYAYKRQRLPNKLYLKPCLSKKQPVVNVFNRNEQKKIETYIFETHDLYSLAILLALYTGVRIGELCALKWSDINFFNNSITITKTVQRLKASKADSKTKTELVISEPKSKTSYRVIPLPQFVMKYIKDFYSKDKYDKYILSDKETIPLDPRVLQYAYKRILNKCDIPYLNFHCLRHTFATRCVTTGWDVKTLSEVLGHSEIKITMDYYFHSSFEFKQQQMNKLKLIS